MDITKTGVQGQQPFTDNATSVAQSKVQVGQFRGSDVVITNLSALAADAAEEMSFGASERAEKKMSDRKAKDGSNIDWNLYKIAQKYLAQVPDLKSPARLNAFAQSLLQKSFSSAQQMLAHLESFSGDVSHQFIALKYAREFIQKQGDFPGLLATIDAALAQLEAEKGPQIRAGINVSKTAFAFEQQGLGSTQALRDQYRDNVLDFTSVRAAAKHLIKEFGRARFGMAIRFLEQGLSSDLNSKTTSLPKAQLAAIAQDLNALKKLRTAMTMASQLFEKLKRNRKITQRDAKQGRQQQHEPSSSGEEEEQEL
jgi:type III secretion protein W